MKKIYLILILIIVAISVAVLGYIGIISPYRTYVAQEKKISQITLLWEAGDYTGVTEASKEFLIQDSYNSEVLLLYGFALFNQAYLGSHEKYQVDNRVVWESIYAIRKALGLGLKRKLERLAYYVLGKNYYLLSGSYLKQSIYYLELSMRHNYTPEDLYEFLSKAYYDYGNTEKATEILIEALNKKKSFVLYLALIDIYFDTGKIDKIPDLLHLVGQYDHTDMEILALKLREARLSMEKGNLDLAIKEFSSIIEIYPQSVEAYYYMGIAYESLGDISKARYEWRRAYRLSPYWDKVIAKLDSDDTF